MEIKEQRNKPILRWAGGKSWMLETIQSFLPAKFNNYHEPFLGGGSVFFNICHNRESFISDSNLELICFYQEVQNNLDNLLKRLKRFKNNQDEYYRVRESQPKKPVDVAARFYYLNRTCFNGLYRVNQSGFYNVPYGYRDVEIIDYDAFNLLKLRLNKVHINCCDFEYTLKQARKGDLIFLDPPYTVAHNKNGFIEYNQKIFSWEDQKRLANYVSKLEEKKIFFIMTNAFHDSIKELYRSTGKHYEVERYSTMGGSVNSRVKISEIIITNCV